MKRARMNSRWMITMLIGSLAIAAALANAGTRPQGVPRLSTDVSR